MTEATIRPCKAEDLPEMLALDHGYETDYVWQMDIQSEKSQVAVSFREVRLPRTMRVEYPREIEGLPDDWTTRSALLVAEAEEQVVGYASLMLGIAPKIVWVTDLVVLPRLRRHGIGSRLLMASQAWATEQGISQLFLEMQSKNMPAIRLAEKLGYKFCGYSDRYYENGDIALFFSKRFT